MERTRKKLGNVRTFENDREARVIDWDVIRAKGETTELTAMVIHALCKIAERHPQIEWDAKPCEFCGKMDKHRSDCPIRILEQASDPKKANDDTS